MAEFLDWSYNHLTGAVVNLPSPQSAVMRAIAPGWHGPYNTKEEALAFYQASKAAHPDWKTPTGILGNIGNAAVAGGDLVTGGGVTEILGGVNLAAWFLRIGEVLLGLVLIAVGIARLTGVQNVVSKVAKVAIPG